MTPIEWYYARGNKQMGPVTAVELKRLAAAGELHPDDLVWREGLTEWAPARSVRGLFEDEAKPIAAEEIPSQPVVPVAKPLAKDVEPETHVPTSKAAAPGPPAWHLVDLLLDSLRSDFNARFVDTTARIFRTCGLYGLLLAMAVTAAFAVVVAMKSNTLGNLLWGVMMLLLLAGAAIRGRQVVRRPGSTQPRHQRHAGLDRAARLLRDLEPGGRSGGAVRIGADGRLHVDVSVDSAGDCRVHRLRLPGLRCPEPIDALTFRSFRQPARASEEAICVLVFLQKVLMRSAPVALGAGVMAGTLMMGYACYEAFSGSEHLMSAQLTAAAARGTLIFSAALPLAAYLLSLLCSLALDLCRAILTLPGELDQVAAKRSRSTKAGSGQFNRNANRH